MTLDGRPAWGGRLAAELTAETLATFGTTCHLCGLDGATTADHLVPRSTGGADTVENLRPAHRACNSSRGTQTVEQWRAGRPATYAPALEPSRQW